MIEPHLVPTIDFFSLVQENTEWREYMWHYMQVDPRKDLKECTDNKKAIPCTGLKVERADCKKHYLNTRRHILNTIFCMQFPELSFLEVRLCEGLELNIKKKMIGMYFYSVIWVQRLCPSAQNLPLSKESNSLREFPDERQTFLQDTGQVWISVCTLCVVDPLCYYRPYSLPQPYLCSSLVANL